MDVDLEFGRFLHGLCGLWGRFDHRCSSGCGSGRCGSGRCGSGRCGSGCCCGGGRCGRGRCGSGCCGGCGFLARQFRGLTPNHEGRQTHTRRPERLGRRRRARRTCYCFYRTTGIHGRRRRARRICYWFYRTRIHPALCCRCCACCSGIIFVPGTKTGACCSRIIFVCVKRWQSVKKLKDNN